MKLTEFSTIDQDSFSGLVAGFNTMLAASYQFHHETAVNGFIFHFGDIYTYDLNVYNRIAENMENIPSNLLQSVEYAVIIDSVLCEQEGQAQIIGQMPSHMGLFF